MQGVEIKICTKVIRQGEGKDRGMALKFMYITNNPIVAEIAEDSGVDRIWIDLEKLGKSKRQAGRNTVMSKHFLTDVARLRPYVNQADLLVRVNPLFAGSGQEIDTVCKSGADIIMLPMFHTADDVRAFVDYVGGRAKVMLLVETAEAVENLEDILKVPGIDEIHIGLNDLHMAYHMNFMFELVADGTVDRVCKTAGAAGIPYGFGGVAGLGEGLLPGEYVLGEHYRLGSSFAILSRTFCDSEKIREYRQFREKFRMGIQSIREYEAALEKQDGTYFTANHKKVQDIVGRITGQRQAVCR